MVMNVDLFHSLVMAHCRERDSEIIVGDLSHMHLFAQGGTAQVSRAVLKKSIFRF